VRHAVAVIAMCPDEPPLRRGEADAFALEPALRCNQLLSQHLVFGDERQA